MSAMLHGDYVVHFDGVTWSDYRRVLAMRGDHAGPRLTCFTAVGSWTLEDERVERAVEPDGCWILGPDFPAAGGRPDLAIEVVFGGIDKLDVYRKLGVREVWVWDRDVLTAYQLVDERYHPVEGSVVLPGIDLGLINRLCTVLPTSRAIRELQAALLDQKA